RRPDVSRAGEWTRHPLQQYRQLARESLRAGMRRLPRLRCPLLLLWGDRDAFLFPPAAQEWAPFAADVTARLLPGGHWVHRERPEAINRLLGDFFRERRSRGEGA